MHKNNFENISLIMSRNFGEKQKALGKILCDEKHGGLFDQCYIDYFNPWLQPLPVCL